MSLSIHLLPLLPTTPLHFSHLPLPPFSPPFPSPFPSRSSSSFHLCFSSFLSINSASLLPSSILSKSTLIYLTGEDTSPLRKISLVGKEKDGVLILARSLIERDATRTCIDMYDYKSHKSRTIYTCVGNVGVICATINDERSLLAFVTESVNERMHPPICLLAVLGGEGCRREIYKFLYFYLHICRIRRSDVYVMDSRAARDRNTSVSREHPQTSKAPFHPVPPGFQQCVSNHFYLLFYCILFYFIIHFLGFFYFMDRYVLSCSQEECSVFQLPVKQVPGGLTVSKKTKKNPLSKKTTWFEYLFYLFLFLNFCFCFCFF